jgi:hypothetical protein
MLEASLSNSSTTLLQLSENGAVSAFALKYPCCQPGTPGNDRDRRKEEAARNIHPHSVFRRGFTLHDRQYDVRGFFQESETQQ